MAYTTAQYMDVARKLLAKRKEVVKEIDDKLDVVLGKLANLANTNSDEETSAYMMVRDEFKKAGNSYNTKREGEYNKHIDTIGTKLLRRLTNQGVKSMAAAPATFYRENDDKPSVADYGVLCKWIKENDAFEIFEKRVTKKYVVDYLEEYRVLPPGVNLNRSYKVVVRRKNSSKDDED